MDRSFHIAIDQADRKELTDMKKKALVLVTLLLAGMMMLAACGGGETATSGTVTNGTNEVNVAVDLSDGWAAEFAEGAVYVYDSEDTSGDSTAMLITLEQDVYDGYVAESKTAKDCEEGDGYIKYTGDDGEMHYLLVAGDVPMIINVSKDAEDTDAVFARFSFE